MKQKVFFIAAMLTAMMVPQMAKAYDFSAVSPSGQTLYYDTLGGNNVKVTCPPNSSNNTTPYLNFTRPTGNLIIPASVTNEGTTYTVTEIGDKAFFMCDGLTSVTIPGTVTAIGRLAFCYCYGLTSITIPNSVETIGYNAFCGCNLTSVTVPNSVTSMEDGVFIYCHRLSTATLSNSLTSIADGTFADCDSLTSVIIPNSIISIGDTAFRNCASLTSLNIPGSVEEIGASAFAACGNLTQIICHRAIAPTLWSNAFANVPNTIPVHIPCGSMASYQTGWSHFSNFVEWFAFDIDLLSTDTTMGTVTMTVEPTCADSTAVLAARPLEGFRFLHWQDGDTTNPRTVAITSDTTFTACFDSVPHVFTVNIANTDTTMGHVHVDGEPLAGNTVTLTAIANEGYFFLRWQDGNADNPRSVTITSDTTFTASFASKQGIEEADINVAAITVYPNPTSGVVTVDATEVSSIEVYNVCGQLLKVINNANSVLAESKIIDLSSLPSGIYTLKVKTAKSASACRVVKR